jgi:tetratricopeptide (TPR) repeat protein
MSGDFGVQLRKCRKMSRLTQQGLGLRIDRDASTISRFETGGSAPGRALLQDMISVLRLHGVPQEELERLWAEAGYHASGTFEVGVADPLILYLNQVFEKAGEHERRVVSRDVRSIVEIDRGYFAAVKAMQDRRWQHAADDVLRLRRAHDRSSAEFELRFQETLAEASYHGGDYLLAVEYGERALLMARHLAESEQDPEQSLDRSRREADIMLQLGSAYRRLARWAEAKKRYGHAYRLFIRLGDARQSAVCQRKLAAVLLLQSDVRKGLLLCDRSFSECERQGDMRGMYKAKQHMAWGLSMTGQWSAAIDLSNEALSMIEMIGMQGVELDLERAKASMYLADIYRITNKVGEAELLYKRAEKVLNELEKRDIHVRLLRSMIWLGLGQTYVELEGQEWQALQYLRRSRDEQLALGEPLKIPLVENASGLLCLRQGKLRLAEGYLRRARDQFAALGNTYYLGQTLVSLAKLHYAKDDPDALQGLSQDTQYGHGRLFKIHLAKIWSLQGASLLDKGDYSKGADALLAASEAALDFNRQVFREMCDEVFTQAQRLLRRDKVKQAAVLCERFEAFWAGRRVESESQAVVAECLRRTRQEHADIVALELSS